MKKTIIFCVFFCILTTASGCWDIRDITNRAFVTAIGLDMAENPDKKYKVTFEFLDPYKLRQPGSKIVTLVETVEGESIGKAIEQMQGRISGTINFTHLRLLLVGEALARTKHFSDLASFFEKYAEIALRLRLGFVQDGQALDVLRSNPKLSRSVSAEIIRMVQLERDFALSRTNKFFSFLSDLRSSKGVALGSRIISAEGDSLIRHGATVFDNWKLKGFLSSEETQGANWITGISEVTVIGETNSGAYTYRVHKRSLKATPTVLDSELGFSVELTTIGHIVEEGEKSLDFTNPENIEKLEEVLSQVINREIKSAIAKSQQDFQIDYLGFGNFLKQKEPHIYEELNWEEVFPVIPISVEVKAKIDKFGLVK